MHDRLERLALSEGTRTPIGQLDLVAVVAHRLLPVQHLAHDRDVVPHAFGGFAPRGAVPPLDDLRPGNAETDDDPLPTGERVNRHGVHRGCRRCAGRDLHDCRAEFDAFGHRGEIGERRQRIAPYASAVHTE